MSIIDNRVKGIFKSTLLSGGIISHGSVNGYISDAARRAIGMGLAHFQDGQVHYFAKDQKILKRAIVQTLSQTAYGLLRSYPRYLKYFEQKYRDQQLKEKSQTTIKNENGQYFQLIKNQRAISQAKNYTDTIVGRVVHDYLELSINNEGSYYDSKTSTIESNSTYGLVTFVDLHPFVQVTTKNNIVLTTVQGRDYTRKEFISGGDFEISINGKITSKYPEVYPEAEVAKFIKLMMYKGVINCENIILRQFKISQLIIQNYSFPATDCKNIQPYTITCVAVEPSESIQLIDGNDEKVDKVILQTNKWLKLIKFGTQVVDPASLLKLTRLWI